MTSLNKRMSAIVAANVRNELKSQGRTASELADAAGKAQPWMSKRLTGRVVVNLCDLEIIAAALDVSPIALITDEASA